MKAKLVQNAEFEFKDISIQYLQALRGWEASAILSVFLLSAHTVVRMSCNNLVTDNAQQSFGKLLGDFVWQMLTSSTPLFHLDTKIGLSPECKRALTIIYKIHPWSYGIEPHIPAEAWKKLILVANRVGILSLQIQVSVLRFSISLETVGCEGKRPVLLPASSLFLLRWYDQTLVNIILLSCWELICV